MFDIFSKIFRRSWILALLAFWVAIALYGCNPSQLKAKAAQVLQMIVAAVGEASTFNSAMNETL